MRQNFNDGQELIFQDMNSLSSRIEKQLYERVIFELIQKAENVVFPGSFETTRIGSTEVRIGTGVGFQTDATNAARTAAESQRRLLYLDTASDITVDPPDASNDRIDIAVIQANRAAIVTETRKFKDEITEVVSDQSLDVVEDWEATVQVVAGTPAASPVAPAVPAGFIKISEILVQAVSGIPVSGAITDFRTFAPIAGDQTIDSSTFNRLTAGVSTPISTLLADADALLQNGNLDRNDFLDLVTDPAAPALNTLRLYNKGNLLFTRDNGGVVTPVGSGSGGGGGGANWQGDALEDFEFVERVFKFSQGAGQSLTLYVKVPDGYIAGRQIQMFLGFYSPSTADDFNIDTLTSLVRQNVDAINSSLNQHSGDSGDITNTVANQYRPLTLDLTDATGLINAFAVQPGDILRVELTRGTPVGSDDSADLRFIPSSTEVKFG